MTVLVFNLAFQPLIYYFYCFSSVTAGHDSPFNKSTPIIAGEYMEKAFEALGMKLVTRNVALGNNPCMPYDVCIKYFAGNDADIVHWEQNYFCDNKAIMFEQFIRQASTIPTKPIIVFSESDTGHWNKDQCKKGPHKISEHEKALVSSDPFLVVSELNKDEFHRAVCNNSIPYLSTLLFYFFLGTNNSGVL